MNDLNVKQHTTRKPRRTKIVTWGHVIFGMMGCALQYFVVLLQRRKRVCNDLTISERFPWHFTCIDVNELKAGLRRVHLGRAGKAILPNYLWRAVHLHTEEDYVETYMEQLLSHESLHFILFDLFNDIDITGQLDNFDYWNKGNPISFQSSNRR